METQNEEAKKTSSDTPLSEKGGVAGVDSKEGTVEAPQTNNSKVEKDAQIGHRAG